MTLRRLLLTLGWIVVICGGALGAWWAAVDEREPPIGGCAVMLPVVLAAIALAIITEKTRP